MIVEKILLTDYDFLDFLRISNEQVKSSNKIILEVLQCEGYSWVLREFDLYQIVK